MASGPKWENLDLKCLVNILSRVGLESLLLDVPYVCKSWYKATRIPQCWSILNFTTTILNYCGGGTSDCPESLTDELNFSDDDFPERLKERYCLDWGDSNITRFIKNVVKRGNQFVTYVKLPYSCSEDAFIFILNECPNLKTLKLPIFNMEHDLVSLLPSVLGKWKRLENLTLCWSYNMRKILEQISAHCNNFQTLEVVKSRIGESEVSFLATTLPDMKGLRFRQVEIGKENMLRILNSFNKLDCLNARGCVGFDGNDEDILTSAAHIRVLNLEGATLYGTDEDEDDYEVSNYYGIYY